MKKFYSALLLCILVLFLGCANDSEKRESLVSITINSPATQIELDGVVTVSAVLLPAGVDEEVRWNVANAEIIYSNGNIAAIKATELGVATITVAAGDKYDKVEITVTAKKIIMDSVKIESPVTKLKIGKTATLSAVLLPAGASEMVTWSSSDKNIADITTSGVITGIKEGIVTITLTALDKTDSINIEITDNVLYKYIAPSVTYAAVLGADTWINSFKNEILPFWTMDAAKGSPLGNYPTFRANNGSITANTVRYPRMMGRQIYVYSMGYMMTGDETLLELAKAGVDYMLENAKDKTNGGFYGIITSQGAIASDSKTAQDLSYAALGLASYYFVTRDKNVEKELLEVRDLIMTKYWDSTNNRVIDAFNNNFTTEQDTSGGGWELVAQLDQINAYMMLTQPVLSESSRREQFLGDMHTIAETMVTSFWQNGVFWGQHSSIGNVNANNTDFGHTLKSYWMLLQLDKRLPDHPYNKLITDNVYTWIDLASKNRRDPEGWAGEYAADLKSNELWNAMWWSYAEIDQISATLNMMDQRYTNLLATKAQTWLDHYVDKTNYEVYSDYGSGSKTNEWKNGFHSTEHSLIMYMHGKYLEKQPFDLYFAVPTEEKSTFTAKPYIYEGKEKGRTFINSITVDGTTLEKVKVTFDEIY